MNAMTAPDVWSGQDRALTVEDMENMPDDEFRYELDDGVLIVSPAPSSLHQLAVFRLAKILDAACPPELLVLPGPGVNINRYQHRVPDLAVVRADSMDTVFQEQPPVLAVEVASPRTRLYDRNRKKDVYERFAIASYWIVDPDPAQPQLTVFELRDDRYQQVAQVAGEEALHIGRPFPVTVTQSALVQTGR
jgi:Uma2 family endonuclease